MLYNKLVKHNISNNSSKLVNNKKFTCISLLYCSFVFGGIFLYDKLTKIHPIKK